MPSHQSYFVKKEKKHTEPRLLEPHLDSYVKSLLLVPFFMREDAFPDSAAVGLYALA